MYKQILIFVTGLSIGTIATYFYVTDRERKANERDIAELKAYYNNEFKAELLKKTDSKTDMIEQNHNDNSENQYENALKVVKEPEKEEKLPEKEQKVTEISQKRTIISSEEFLEDENYDKETIYYYEQDETFCDPDYVVLPDAIDLIGKENMDNVGMFEDNALYVRNELFGKDLEIIFFDEAYSNIVDIDNDDINEGE